MRKGIIVIFALCCPFLSVFGIHEKVSITLAVGLLLLFLSLDKIKFKPSDLFFCIFIFSMMTSMLLNFSFTSSGFLYLTSFAVLFFAYYKTVQTIPIRPFLHALNSAFILSTIYIFYEFTFMNFLPELFVELPRINVADRKFLINAQFFRARGFAEEPGHMGMFYEFSVPLLIPIWRAYSLRKQLFFAFATVLVLLFLGSSFSLVLFSLFAFIFILIQIKKHPKILLIVLTLLFIGVLFLVFNDKAQNTFLGVVESIFNKVFLNQENYSVSDRTSKLYAAIETIANNPIFGIGPMNFETYTGYTSSLNLYLDLYMYSGLLGITTFLIWILYLIQKHNNVRYRNYLLLSIAFILLHSIITANFWFPYLWISLALLSSLSNTRNEGTHNYQ